MEQCNHVFILGARSGIPEVDEIIVDRNEATGISVADTSKLVCIGTLRDLCDRVPVADLLQAAKDCCDCVRMDDFSLDLTAAAKYIAQLEPMRPAHGYDCSICVIDKHTVICQFGMFSIGLHRTGPWPEVATFAVRKNPHTTDVEALAATIWMLTNHGWDHDFIEWLGIKASASREENDMVLRQKLGL